MPTSSIRKQTAKKSATADAQAARKIAFQELWARTEAETKAARAKRRAEKYESMRGAAKRFKRLSKELSARTELRNITKSDHGYSVRFVRGGENFDRHFAGVSEESLSAAIRFRDQALKVLGQSHYGSVPGRVLQALRLSRPVVGVARQALTSSYVVTYKDAKGQSRLRHFYFLYVPEEDAYAAAIEFLEQTLKHK